VYIKRVCKNGDDNELNQCVAWAFVQGRSKRECGLDIFRKCVQVFKSEIPFAKLSQKLTHDEFDACTMCIVLEAYGAETLFYSKTIIALANRYGSVQLLKSLRKYMEVIPLDAFSIRSSLAKGHLSLVNYLVENGAPFSPWSDLEIAILNDAVESAQRKILRTTLKCESVVNLCTYLARSDTHDYEERIVW
jgi:hypothetical protein